MVSEHLASLRAVHVPDYLNGGVDLLSGGLTGQGVASAPSDRSSQI